MVTPMGWCSELPERSVGSMQNAYNLNLHLGGQDATAALSALVEVLRGVFRGDGWMDARDDEAAGRTLVVARLSDGPWLTVFDDGPVEELEGLAESITEQMGSSVVSMLEHDGDVWHLNLYRGGKAVDRLSVREEGEYVQGPIEADLQQWSHVLAPDRVEKFAATANRMPGQLNAAAEVLGIGPSLYHEIEDVCEDEFPTMQRLRLVRAGKRKKASQPKETKGMLSPEPPFSAKMIPELLIGKPAEVKRRWKRIVKKAAQCGDWAEALAGVEHIEIEDVSSMLTSPPNPYESNGIDRALLYLVDGVLVEQFDDREQYWNVSLSGMDRPWFCLAMVAGYPHAKVGGAEARFAAQAIRKMVRWWPELIAWDERLDIEIHSYVSRPYPRVYFSMVEWVEGLGYDRETEVRRMFDMEPDDAVMQVLRWLKESGY